MKPDNIPIPPDLVKNPELAILSVLRRTLDITDYALMAHYPEIYDDNQFISEQTNPRISIIVARRILNLTSDLQTAIDGYRYRIKEEQKRKDNNEPNLNF